MRNLIISFVLFSLVLTGCNGQNNNKANDIKYDTTTQIQPKTDIRVDKKYDENGNLIRYDSTYSYYYSNIQKDTILRDSIFNNFRNHLDGFYNFSSDPFFNDFFFQDSLLQYDFYNNDFFIERFRKNQERMNKLLFDMDSIKNNFFYKQFKEPENRKNAP